MTPLLLGYKLSAEQFDPRTLLELVVEAEQLGFDSAAISDHFQPWRHTDGHAPHSLSWLGAATQRTSRISLGTSVLTPTFRHHPAVVAQAVATLAVLAPGRIWLGVGTGEAMNETPIGTEWPEPPERLRRLREAIDIMQQLWRDERVTFDGVHFRTRNATLYDRPDEPVPVYVAAAGPAAARLAGRRGDGLICTSGKDPALYTETLLPALDEGARAASRDSGSLARIIEMKVSYDHDPARARNDTRVWAALALTPEEKRDVDDARELERRADALPVERAASRWLVASDPDEHVAQLQRYLDMGFRHLMFHAPGADQPRFLRTYAAEILPRLRALRLD